MANFASGAPSPRLTVVTLGVSSMRQSIRFYQSLRFPRRMSATGEQVAFFETGGPVLALFPWSELAKDADADDEPRPAAFRGMTLAWNCASADEVDAVLAFAIETGATLAKAAHPTDYGGYSGYFSDPDGHLWEVVTAPGIELGTDGRVHLPD